MSARQETHFVIGSRSRFIIGVGSRTAAVLIDRFGSPAAVFESSSHSLESAGLRRETIDAIKSSEPREKAAREIEELVRLDGEALTLASERYPKLLRETYDPPIVIYCLGDVASAFSQPAIAIVGSRRCSTYGRNVAEKLSRDSQSAASPSCRDSLAEFDSAAHRGALDGRGLTVGVMGTGLDAVYPKENRKLAARIAEQGVLVTEFPLATPPASQNFPFRNRVISGSRWV